VCLYFSSRCVGFLMSLTMYQESGEKSKLALLPLFQTLGGTGHTKYRQDRSSPLSPRTHTPILSGNTSWATGRCCTSFLTSQVDTATAHHDIQQIESEI
jgi:hypothetical protein